jgi:hypothetical protein
MCVFILLLIDLQHSLMTDRDIAGFLDTISITLSHIRTMLIYIPRHDQERMEGYFNACKEEMDKYVQEHRGSMTESIFRNKLIFAMRDYIRDFSNSTQITPSYLFGVAEESFRRLFGHDLNLPRGLPPAPAFEWGHGEGVIGPQRPTDNSSIFPFRGPREAPAGPSHREDLTNAQCDILHNLHRRLSELERRVDRRG